MTLVADRRPEALELATRRRVFRCVESYPGLHLRELARQCGLEPNHAKYHLEYLEQHGLLSRRAADGYLRFFPRVEASVGTRDVVSVDDKRLLGLLRRPVPLHIVLGLLASPDVSFSEIARRIRLSLAATHYHLSRMEREGLVAGTRVGRERRYSIVDPARVVGLLVRHRPPDGLVSGFLEAWDQLELG